MKTLINILLFTFLVSCRAEVQNNEKMTYPYRADNKKILTSRAGVKKIVRGNNKMHIINILGKPDEINETYDKNTRTKIIGYSYLYIMQRLKAEGSVKDKAEKLYRIHFDLSDSVIRVDKVGL